MVTIGEKYVERVEKALVETLILSECRDGPKTVENVWPRIRDMGFTEKVDQGFVKSAFNRLKRDNHLEERDDRYSITDDGREDVQKLEPVLRQVSSAIGGTRATRPTEMGGGPSGIR